MEKYTIIDDINSPVAESYRKIATNIEFANIDENIKTIMNTSTLASEGKSTTLCNIAIVMTEQDKKILLIDLDLRKPTIHKKFKLSNKTGLTDLLLRKDDYKKYINHILPKLDIITAGKIPSNPAEIINSKSIRELIKDLKKDYDYIFVDVPPLISVSDPLTISTYMDAVLLTVAYAEAERDAVKKAVDSLKNVNANIIGTILNKVPVTKNNKYYYYYELI